MSGDGNTVSVEGEAYRCSTCQGAVPMTALRASVAHPHGEADCPHCSTRVAKLDHASWRGGLRMTWLVLGILGSGIAIREWPDGTWWPFALLFVSSVGALVYLRVPFNTAQRVLLPVMRY